MKAIETQGKTPDQLTDMVLTLKKELFNLRFQAASGELANTSRFRQVRRDIARIKTAMNAPAEAAPKAKKEPKAKAAPKAKTKKKEA